MKGLKYQLKSVLRDKFCLMTFLLPILVAVALNFMGSIDLSTLGELHFGVLENNLTPQAVMWLGRYGPVTGLWDTGRTDRRHSGAVYQCYWREGGRGQHQNRNQWGRAGYFSAGGSYTPGPL